MMQTQTHLHLHQAWVQNAAGALPCTALRVADQAYSTPTCLTWQLASPRPTFSRESWVRLHSLFPLARSLAPRLTNHALLTLLPPVTGEHQITLVSTSA